MGLGASAKQVFIMLLRIMFKTSSVRISYEELTSDDARDWSLVELSVFQQFVEMELGYKTPQLYEGETEPRVSTPLSYIRHYTGAVKPLSEWMQVMDTLLRNSWNYAGPRFPFSQRVYLKLSEVLLVVGATGEKGTQPKSLMEKMMDTKFRVSVGHHLSDFKIECVDADKELSSERVQRWIFQVSAWFHVLLFASVVPGMTALWSGWAKSKLSEPAVFDVLKETYPRWLKFFEDRKRLVGSDDCRRLVLSFNIAETEGAFSTDLVKALQSATLFLPLETVYEEDGRAIWVHRIGQSSSLSYALEPLSPYLQNGMVDMRVSSTKPLKL